MDCPLRLQTLATGALPRTHGTLHPPYNKNSVRYGAPTLILMWTEVLWDTMLCHWVTVYWHFALIFKVCGVHFFILFRATWHFKKVLHSFKTWGNTKPVTQHINLKTWILKNRIRQPEIGQTRSTHSKRPHKRSLSSCPGSPVLQTYTPTYQGSHPDLLVRTHNPVAERLTDVVTHRRIVCRLTNEELVFYVHVMLRLHDGIDVCLVDALLHSLRIQEPGTPARNTAQDLQWTNKRWWGIDEGPQIKQKQSLDAHRDTQEDKILLENTYCLIYGSIHYILHTAVGNLRERRMFLLA